MRASAQQSLLLSGRDQHSAVAGVRMFSSKKDKKGALLLAILIVLETKQCLLVAILSIVIVLTLSLLHRVDLQASTRNL